MNLFRALSLLGFALLVSGCAQQFPDVEKEFEQNWVPTQYSGHAYLLPTAKDAFAQRVSLIRQANSSIDMTYFSWESDTLGLVLFNEVKAAADRGVRVRLTLDDLLVFNDKWLAELNTHPNIDIKLFNPFHSRKLGWLGRAAEFTSHQQQLDNRLHEKYFNVDQNRMILGGRNVGDAYFGYHKQANFFDMDTLFKGDIITAFAAHFNHMWDSSYVVDISELIEANPDKPYKHFERLLEEQTHKNSAVIENIERSVDALPLPQFVDVSVRPVFDSLEKVETNKPYFRTRAERAIESELNHAKTAVISTPYLLPTDGHFRVIDQLVNNDAQVTLITNSSASNDSGFVPAYYEKYRKALLGKGVHMLEYKDDAFNDDHYYHANTYYHNKTLVLDNRVTFIGSSNFDPRSDFLNVEFGVFVESPEFAEQVINYLTHQQQKKFWQVTLTDNDEIIWTSGGKVHTGNPNYGRWHEIPNGLFRLLNGEFEL
ncbi:phospholipase D-like domain-containing protein [Vibrio ulleungensis]|uniref:Phospholipase D family protein n=1 Tax=Vibrio ulleungensis TaxID=2807619 RepID=A0ABS2HGU3_9VIBR|nr:phospholipase D family protein [Vibrio ulleungensis]MBM7035312.1 phospholipase D family protein [Vibrio ulleungensis]